jgi:hypothetical protein
MKFIQHLHENRCRRLGRFLPSPDELWEKTLQYKTNGVKFAAIPLRKRRYQQCGMGIGSQKYLRGARNNEDRILTLMGTGKRQSLFR